MSFSQPLLALSMGIFVFGILCVILRRSLLAIFVGIELMLAAGNLALPACTGRCSCSWS